MDFEDCNKLKLLYLIKKRRESKTRRWYVRPINLCRMVKSQFHELVLELRTRDVELFIKYFRMTPTTFDHLLSLVLPKIQHYTTHSMPISAAERLALTIRLQTENFALDYNFDFYKFLRLLATGDAQQSMAFAYYIALSTVNKIFHETCRAIWTSLSEEYVKAPTSVNEWKIIANDYWNMWNFPLCLGAIDGKHVQIVVSIILHLEFYFIFHATFL